MTTAQQLQAADLVAEQILNATRKIDTGELNYTTIEVYLPVGFVMMTDNGGYSLVMTLSLGNAPPGSNVMWSETFTHQIIIDEVQGAGNIMMVFHMESDVIHIDCTNMTN